MQGLKDREWAGDFGIGSKLPANYLEVKVLLLVLLWGMGLCHVFMSSYANTFVLFISPWCLHCFDTVGWAAGSASST